MSHKLITRRNGEFLSVSKDKSGGSFRWVGDMVEATVFSEDHAPEMAKVIKWVGLASGEELFTQSFTPLRKVVLDDYDYAVLVSVLREDSDLNYEPVADPLVVDFRGLRGTKDGITDPHLFSEKDAEVLCKALSILTRRRINFFHEEVVGNLFKA